MIRRINITLSIVALAGFTAYAEATLVNRPGGMIYDDVLDITWIADAGRANADVGTDLSWADAISWADNLVYGGYSDWRLPTMDVNGDGTVVDCTDFGVTELQCRDNEYDYLYTINGVSLSSPGSFVNIGNLHYWSSTSNAAFPNLAWLLNLDTGFRGATSKGTVNRRAIAVRNGDVSPVPVPAAIWLFIGGLLGIAVPSFRFARLAGFR